MKIIKYIANETPSSGYWGCVYCSCKNNIYMYRVSQKKVGSQKTSNCSNSLNFEAKIKCNTIKPNVPKWRKTCTGLKFDLVHFNGPQQCGQHYLGLATHCAVLVV